MSADPQSVLRSLPCFVISLPRDEERRAHMQAQLSTLALSAEFIPAVDGRTLGGVTFVNPFAPANDALVDRILPPVSVA